MTSVLVKRDSVFFLFMMVIVCKVFGWSIFRYGYQDLFQVILENDKEQL